MTLTGRGITRRELLLSNPALACAPRAFAQRNGPQLHALGLNHGPEAGGARGGTPETFFGDPDGLLIQLQDVRYCGGGGYLGDVCLA